MILFISVETRQLRYSIPPPSNISRHPLQCRILPCWLRRLRFAQLRRYGLHTVGGIPFGGLAVLFQPGLSYKQSLTLPLGMHRRSPKTQASVLSATAVSTMSSSKWCSLMWNKFRAGIGGDFGILSSKLPTSYLKFDTESVSRFCLSPV